MARHGRVGPAGFSLEGRRISGERYLIAALAKGDLQRRRTLRERFVSTNGQFLKPGIKDPMCERHITQTLNLRLQTTYVGNMEETNETSQTRVRRVYYFLARRTPHTDGRRGSP